MPRKSPRCHYVVRKPSCRKMRKNSKRTPNCTTAKGSSGRMTKKTSKYYSPGAKCSSSQAKNSAIARYVQRRTSKRRPSKNSAAAKIAAAMRRRFSNRSATAGKVYDSIDKGMRAVKNGEIFATANGRYKKVSGKKNVKM